MLQTFDDIKLYSVPTTRPNENELIESNGTNQTNAVLNNNSGSHSSQRVSRRGGTNNLSSPKLSSPGGHTHGTSSRSGGVIASVSSSSSSEIVEINLRDIFDQIVSYVNKNTNVIDWFKLTPPPTPSTPRQTVADSSGLTTNGISDDADNVSTEHVRYPVRYPEFSKIPPLFLCVCH